MRVLNGASKFFSFSCWKFQKIITKTSNNQPNILWMWRIISYDFLKRKRGKKNKVKLCVRVVCVWKYQRKFVFHFFHLILVRKETTTEQRGKNPSAWQQSILVEFVRRQRCRQYVCCCLSYNRVIFVTRTRARNIYFLLLLYCQLVFSCIRTFDLTFFSLYIFVYNTLYIKAQNKS